MQLRGRTALITGAASGLGRATAHALVTAGARVVLVDLARAAAEQVGAEFGDAAVVAPADITDPSQVQAAIGLGVETFGDLHVAVNCAGVAVAARTLGREGPHDLDLFRQVVAVNLVGTFNVCRLAAARMATQRPVGEERGVLINTASVAAFEGQVGQVAYAASKGGVASMTLPIARDLSRQLIRCVTIAPGVFDTPMTAGLPEEARRALAGHVPHPQRLGRADEFGLLVRQIVENAYLNGDVVRLDGALRMPAR